MHNQSLVDLQKQSSIQLSQQVLNAIAGVIDQTELPDFYYVEGGNSAWGSSNNTGVSFDIRPPLPGTDLQQIAPNTRFNENWNLTNQYNDFGPAAMMRVSAIYVFLCYPLNLGGGELPNGALYTAVSKSDSKDDFVIYTKTADKQYLGVPKEKQLEFFKLSRDVTYWSRYLNPDPKDLESSAGMLYLFFSQYPQTETHLAQSVQDYHKAVNSASQTTLNYQNETKKVSLLEEKFFNAEKPKSIEKTILENAYKQRDQWFQFMISSTGNRTNKKNQMEALHREASQLLHVLESAVTSIQMHDPNQDRIVPANIIKPFHDRIDGIVANDPAVMKTVMDQLPSSAGIDAQDPLDKLYRERFEGLPQRFAEEEIQIQSGE